VALRVINFDGAEETIPPRTNNRTPQLVHPSQRSVATTQALCPLQSQSTHPLFLLYHIPHRTKPQPQRLQDSPRRSSLR